MDLSDHWETAYRLRSPHEQSWFQRTPAVSLELIKGVTTDESQILDVGGGASTLVDGLVLAGYRHISVLDLSPTAIKQARSRLASTAAAINWLEADILTVTLPKAAFHLWHDRAVFHFLTEASGRERYIHQARRALRPGGYMLVATFAEDGPARCSGLDVVRYSEADLHATFGADFKPVKTRHELHRTPDGIEQSFVYCLCQYEPLATASLLSDTVGAGYSR